MEESKIDKHLALISLAQDSDLLSPPPVTPPTDLLPNVPARLPTTELHLEQSTMEASKIEESIMEESNIGETMALNKLPQDSDLPSRVTDIMACVPTKPPTVRSLFEELKFGKTLEANNLPQDSDLPSPTLAADVLPEVPAQLPTGLSPSEECKVGETLSPKRPPQDNYLPSPTIDVLPEAPAQVLTKPYPFREYKVGETLSLSVLSQDSDLLPPTISVRIRELKPWTFSCTMIVDINGAPERTAFLKLYDRRFSHGMRKNEYVDPREPAIEEDFIQYVQSGAVNQFLHNLRHVESFQSDTEDDWETEQEEALAAHKSLEYFETESAVYNVLREYQGKAIPRLLAAVDLNLTPPGVDDNDVFHVKGLLLEYIDGFTMADITEHAPRSEWQDIVDQGVAATHILGEHNILDRDRRPINFMITPKEEGGFRVVMLDFGVARFRREDESDSDWGRAKLTENEEGAVGLVMKKMLSHRGFELLYERSERYMEWAGLDEHEPLVYAKDFKGTRFCSKRP